MLNEAIWKSLTGNPALRQLTPGWMHPFFSMSFAEVEMLSQAIKDIEVATEPHFSKPRVDLVEIKSSYLDFLRSEIRVRGRESKRAAEIYRGRLEALSKHEGKMIYQMVVFGKIDAQRILGCILYFLPDNCGIVWVE